MTADRAWARKRESCPFVAHAATCSCHEGGPIMVDIPPATGESLRQRLTREEDEAREARAAAGHNHSAKFDPTCAACIAWDKEIEYRMAAGAGLHPLEEVLRGVEQDQADRIQTERDRILDAARVAITGSRQRDYGSPEPGFTRTGKMWAAILGLEEITAEQVALCMAALKISRLATNPSHRDSWVDGPGYFALGGEVAYERGVAGLNAAIRGDQL